MAELRKLECQMCGGALEKVSEGSYECIYCHSKYEIDLTKVSDELIINLNRASAYRRKAKFDEAMEDYESILRDAPDSFEAAWGLMLASKHVTYNKYDEGLCPMFYEVGSQSFFDNAYYKKAMSLCPTSMQEEYALKADELDRLRNNILRISKESDYDVTVCCDEYSSEATMATPLVTALKARTGKKVFWSGLLTDKLGHAEREPYLYNAISKSKLLVVMTSSLDNCQSQAEEVWRRYLRMAKDDPSKKVCLALVDCDIDDMPSELKRNPYFDVSNGDFEQILELAKKQFNVAPPKKEKPAREDKPVEKKPVEPKKAPEKSSAPSSRGGETRPSQGSSVTADSVRGAGFSAGSGDVSTNPEALRMLAKKLRDYGNGQNGVITECLYALGRLTGSWDDSHMMQILDEMNRLRGGYESKLVEINGFAEWLEQKASLLESKKNMY